MVRSVITATEQPSLEVGTYVHGFLEAAPWVRRRVETVRFLDAQTVKRSVTLDIGMAEVCAAAPIPPLVESRPLVPLTLMRKDLLMNFDLRGRSGAALPVVPREVDAYMAWSALAQSASTALGLDVATRYPGISRHLREIAWCFPDDDDSVDLRAEDLNTWNAHGFVDDELRTWEDLVADPGFQKVLRDFTFGFLLVTQLEVGPHLEIVKLTYRQNIDPKLYVAESIGLAPIELDIDMPGLALDRGHHVRVEAPAGLVLTDVGIFRLIEARDAAADPADGPTPRVFSYQKRADAEWAEVYTAPPAGRADDHVLAVHMSVSLSGFLRSAWLATLFTVALLVISRLRLNDVEQAIDSRAGAAVAIALIGPSLLSAYLVRPDEHAITSRLIRPLRYAVAACALVGYAGAGIVALAGGDSELETQFNVLVAVAGALAAYVSLVLWRTSSDIRRALKRSTTVTDQIVDVSVEP